MSPRVLLETSRFRVVEHDAPTGAGGARSRQVVEHPGATVILPLLGEGQDQRVVLIRNYRIAVGRTLVELPAGTLEPGEPPLETAQRELTEETGYTATRWTTLPGLLMSPGILHEQMHAFIAEGLQSGPPRREAGEEIENLVVPVGDAIEMVRRGDVVDAKTVAVLLYWWAFGSGEWPAATPAASPQMPPTRP